jgi:hypothetical protein
VLPVLLAAPEGRPARLLGRSPALLPILQNLRTVGWPCVLHDPEGGGLLAGFSGLQIAHDAPPSPALRQSSLVLIAAGCPPPWREAAKKELAGTGIPLWDESDPTSSSLAFPRWFPGRAVSAAAWSGGGLQAWEEGLVAPFFAGTEGLFASFLKLAGELKTVFEGLDEEAFRGKVLDQATRPEVLALLLQGKHEQAKMTVLRIVGSTTRTL